ncbi:MAG: SUMF1/EgtB/PvdO family nonheme iron enzyme [Pseudomonadota bacterium]
MTATWDLFIAFAGPDRARAEDLFGALKARCPSLRVFWEGLIVPGKPFDTSLSAALDASRVLVALISGHTEAAWYQRAEIARAIALARTQPEGHRIVPVQLEEAQAYGCEHLHPLRADLDSMASVADRLAELFPQMEQQAAALRRDGAVPAAHREALRCYLDWVLSRADTVRVFAREEERALEELYVQLRQGPARGGGAAVLGVPSAEADHRQTLEELVAAEPSGRWTLQGDPGAGKTTLLRHVALLRARAAQADLAEGFLRPTSVPLLIRLAELGDEKPQIEALRGIEDHPLLGRAAAEAALTWALTQGRALLLLDGFDELPPMRVEICRKRLSTWAGTLPDCGLVITSRRFGYHRPSYRFQELELLPFSDDDQAELLGKWLGEEHAAQVRTDIEKCSTLRDLARNPFTLTLLAILARDTAAPLPRRRREVYQRIIAHKVRGGQGDRPLALSPTALRTGMAELALTLLLGGADRWSTEELSTALGALPDIDAVGSTGLMVEEEEDRWRFTHRSIQEVLAAEALAAHDQGWVLGFIADLRKRSRQKRTPPEIGRWAEVFALYAGMAPDPLAVLRGLKAKYPGLVLRALASVEGIDVTDLLVELGCRGKLDAGDAAALVREVLQRITDREAALGVLTRLGEEARDLGALQLVGAAMLVLGEVEERLDAVRQRAERIGGPHALGIPPRPWVEILPGEFWMGSPEGDGHHDEHPRHRVTLTRGFRLLATPVTQALYLVVMGERPSHFTGDLRRPVESVNWADALRCCELWSHWAEGTIRLPTEAEWECACRAGTEGPWSFEEGALGEHAWFGEGIGGETHPVAEKRPNPWGLYDMHGNVWEWCQDGFGSYPAGPATDPVGPADASGRVIRGGSYWSSADGGHSAYRNGRHPRVRDRLLGFRVAWSPSRG